MKEEGQEVEKGVREEFENFQKLWVCVKGVVRGLVLKQKHEHKTSKFKALKF